MKFRRNHSNLRFSRQLAIIQISAVATLILVIAGTAVWISREHDKLAETGTETMISGGLLTLEDKLRTITVDYSYWTEAYEAIRAGDMPWIWNNIGIGAAETGTTDLMIVIQPDETAQFGWIAGTGATPATDLLPADTIAAMLRLLDGIPIDSRQAASRFMRVGDLTWLFAISRVMPYDGVPEGVVDSELPRHLFGLRIDDSLMSELGTHFLIDDLAISTEPEPGMSSMPLAGDSGLGGYAVWTPSRPGNAILEKLGATLSLVFGTIFFVSVLVSRHVIGSAKRLEHAVGAAQAAQAADRYKTDFLANVSHELRTPMNGIIGVAQLMQKMDLEPKLAGMVSILMKSARTQMALIEDLLDIARIDSGQMQLGRLPFNPVSVLNEVRNLVELCADKKGLSFSVETPVDFDAQVLGDEGCFRQILTNLIYNAIKFTDRGGVTVRMVSTVKLDQVSIAITVADTGRGIDPKDHLLIFERFGQVDDALMRGAGGTGLGLAITKSLVELMKGKLSLRSELGKGAEFLVEIALENVASPGNASLAAE